jgi:hypothetical protein
VPFKHGAGGAPAAQHQVGPLSRPCPEPSTAQAVRLCFPCCAVPAVRMCCPCCACVFPWSLLQLDYCASLNNLSSVLSKPNCKVRCSTASSSCSVCCSPQPPAPIYQQSVTLQEVAQPSPAQTLAGGCRLSDVAPAQLWSSSLLAALPSCTQWSHGCHSVDC